MSARDELARAAKNALDAYAEGWGSYKGFQQAKKALADYDAAQVTDTMAEVMCTSLESANP